MNNLRFIVFTSMIIVFTGCQSVNYVAVDFAAQPQVTDKEASAIEKQIASAGYYFMQLNYKFINDPEHLHKLNRLGARITRYTEQPEVKYKYFIIESPFHNAFALPDGYIFITSRLFDALESDEKIQAVLSHEIAHITHKHLLEHYELNFGNKAPTNIFGKKVVTLAASIGSRRAYELQADQTGMRYLYRSGIPPEVMIEVLGMFSSFEKLDAVKQEERSKDNNIPRSAKNLQKILMISHPENENRVVNARNYIDIIKNSEEIQYNPDDFTF